MFKVCSSRKGGEDKKKGGRVDPREERPKEKRKLSILSWPLGKKRGLDFILRRKESKLPFVKATRKLSFCVFFVLLFIRF